MTTTPTNGAAIQRYKIGYYTDDWGMSSSSPSGIPDASGAWVRYEDHVAALAAWQATAAQAVVPAGWNLVPTEPTQAMLDAVVTSMDDFLLGKEAEKQYREDWAAMLAAAPAQPAAEPANSASHGQAYPTIGDLCARIKAADDAAADMDYMLDSDDCIKVLRGEWKAPLAMDKPDRAARAPADSVLEDALSDAVRVPLDSLHADAAYLIGRLRDGSMPYVRVIEIIRERIDAAKAAIRASASHGQAPAPEESVTAPGGGVVAAGRFMDEAAERRSAQEGYENRIKRVSERNPHDEGMYSLGWWDRAWKAAAPTPAAQAADSVPVLPDFDTVEQHIYGACRRYITQDMLEPIHNLIRDAIDADRAARASAESVPAPVPPPECETEAEKRAFAFGWFKALESERMKADSVQEDAARYRWLSEHIQVAWNEGKFTSLVRIVSEQHRQSLNASVDRMMAGDWSDADAARAAQAADSVLEDAARYRLVRRGQHWSVIDGLGNDLRAPRRWMQPWTQPASKE